MQIKPNFYHELRNVYIFHCMAIPLYSLQSGKYIKVKTGLDKLVEPVSRGKVSPFTE